MLATIREHTGDFAPVVVFAYNRPDKLGAMLASLRACDGFAESPVTVFVDGPKNDLDEPGVQQVRELAKRFLAPNVKWQFREQNEGLRNSIFSGVTDVVTNHGKVIVLEDDLVLSSSALTYFNTFLRHYEHAEQIWSVAGYMYDVPSLRSSTSAIALPFAHPWGWATWSRAWTRFDLDNQPSMQELRARSFRSAFDMDGLYPFTDQLKNSIQGRVNSWFIHWYFTIFQHRGMSIFPPRRIVDNFGFSDGSHGGALNPHERLVTRPRPLETIPQPCDPAEVSYASLDAMRSCRELRVQRFIARAGSAKRKVKAAI
ncbi:hypothetical protein JRC04_16175 [Mycolicibacterium sp. S2-37]|uniref:hypothetical protein n=1 Tax=Mycolicibacterium sp. S2-37 TaxID=2810297 RepID=UPI001A94CB81|nr:hypothetical protein [Mycolicibacterium sp. S2-37]MBO0679005.1 hypothetical protein [Mycolicibacterium sp. S2-37]